MGKKPNAADIARALALLGGGAKKDGGDGMLGGIENVFKIGILLGEDIIRDEKEQQIYSKQINAKIEDQEK